MTSKNNTRVVVEVIECPPDFDDSVARVIERQLSEVATYMVAHFPSGLDDAAVLDLFQARVLEIEDGIRRARKADTLAECAHLLAQQAGCFLALAQRCARQAELEDVAHG
ncbi:hypothetical protein [Azospirillum sp. A39]|uniref:hypothetical protein n=1 Tax=Azospirillum sp. A39 TaxID=3462279 RepID=UPI0040460008